MKASKEQVENAILFFAKTFGQEENYKSLMKVYRSTPEIVEMIVYEMFLQKFNPYHCTDEEYEHYKIIHEYATELKQNGLVSHEENNIMKDFKISTLLGIVLYVILGYGLLSSCNDEKPNITPNKVNIEGCEYFVNKNSYGNILTHKGNCKNPIHTYH